MIGLGDKFEGLKKAYILGILTVCYIVGELGHYLIGVTSRATAREVIKKILLTENNQGNAEKLEN